MAYHRSQILLENEQYERLARLAAESHRSISEIAREMIAEGILQLDRRREHALRAMDELATLREETMKRSGVLRFDPVEEARADRQRELGK